MQGPENEMVSPSGWLPIAGQHLHVCPPAGINATNGGTIECCVYSHMAILCCSAQLSLTPVRRTALNSFFALSILIQIPLALLHRRLCAIPKGIAACLPQRLPAGCKVLSALEDLHVSDFWLHTPHRNLLHDVKPLLLMLRGPLLLLRLHNLLWLRHLRRNRDAIMTAQQLICCTLPSRQLEGLHLGYS